MTHYCTYFDWNYLVRGLALHRSMLCHCRPFRLHILCLDDATFRYLTSAALEGVTPIRLADLERADPDLLAAKPTRSRVEYYFTITPALTRHILASLREGESVVYIDSDFWFFSSHEPFTGELEKHSVVIVGHRFPRGLRHLENHGRYNVGILGFKNDPEGRACLAWWRERCLEWCFDRLEGGKFADQKYLDEWPVRFCGVYELPHAGVNYAPWNVATHRLTRERGRLLVDGDPLVCYHFHRLKRLGGHAYQLNLRPYGASLAPVLARHVYRPYIAELQTLMSAVPDARPKSIRSSCKWRDQLIDLAFNGPVLLTPGRGMWIL